MKKLNFIASLLSLALLFSFQCKADKRECGQLSDLLKKHSADVRAQNMWFSLWSGKSEQYIVVISGFDKTIGVEGFEKKNSSIALMPWLIFQTGNAAMSSRL